MIYFLLLPPEDGFVVIIFYETELLSTLVLAIVNAIREVMVIFCSRFAITIAFVSLMA